jgi:hypothetical protein
VLINLNSFGEVAFYHSQFRHGFEVAWALWLGKLFSVTLPEKSLGAVSLVDDPLVALLALDLKDSGFAEGLDTSLWASHMQAEHLYTENWILAYEAHIRGWLPSLDGPDYVAADGFFGILSKNGVMFYDTGTRKPSVDSEWIEGY